MKRVHPFLSQRALRFLHHQRKRQQVYPYYKPFRLVSISYQQVQMIVFAVLFFKYKCLSLWHPRCQLWLLAWYFLNSSPSNVNFAYLRVRLSPITCVKIFVILIVIGVVIAIIIENTFRLCGSIHFLVALIARSRESADFDILLPFNTRKFIMYTITSTGAFVCFTHSWFVPK
jgi:hypothetical protein